MKKFLLAMMVVGAVFASYGCGEKSNADKADDAATDTKEAAGDAAADAKDAAGDAKDDAAKKLEEVGK